MECLFSKRDVEQSIDRLAADITRDFVDQNPIILCVMTGGVVLAAELMLRLPFALQFDYVHVSRYRGEEQGGDLEWKVKPHLSVQDRAVIIVDDILDEGVTLQAVRSWCENSGASRVVSVVLVVKNHDRRLPSVTADYQALQVPDRYVVGYGMDRDTYWRNLPGVYAFTSKSAEG